MAGIRQLQNEAESFFRSLYFGSPFSTRFPKQSAVKTVLSSSKEILFSTVSRGKRPHYVQDALRGEAAELARLIREGARVMVCGGRGMAQGVAEALAEILAPVGLTPEVLKAEGRYVEDVY